MEIDSMVTQIEIQDFHRLTKDAEIMEVDTDHQLHQEDRTGIIQTIVLLHHQ